MRFRMQSVKMKILFALLTRVFATCSITFFLISSPAISQTFFYHVSNQDLLGSPGDLIRYEPMLGAPLGSTAYRILYRSTGLNGNVNAVSGVVIVPFGPAPAGGRPVVAWAHPTSGVVPHCAPSLALTLFLTIPGLRDMLALGYAVVATDYPGLGTAGPHPYLIGESEARSVLDAVRAARLLPPANAGSNFVVWGHSQGGHAALYTGLLASRYAPDLSLLGVAAAAPATELEALMKDDFNTAGGKSLTAMALWSWSRLYSAQLNHVVEPQAVPVIDQLANICVESIFDLELRKYAVVPLSRIFLRVPDLTVVEPWRSIMLANTPHTLPPQIPVFIAQGTADALVQPSVTRDYVRRLCRSGSAVQFLEMPNVNHGFIGLRSSRYAVSWMRDRFAGQPAPNNCL